jgi:DNA-binding phage protein
MGMPTQEQMQQKIRDAEAAMPAALETGQRLEKAMQEQNFSGYLRREFHRCKKSSLAIVEETGISRHDLSQFLEGRSTLTSEQIDRLVACLDIQLAPVKR